MQKSLFRYLFILILSSLFLTTNTIHAFAATIRAGESVDIPENQTSLRDLYLFGTTITVDAPVTNDLTVAGRTITLNGDVTNSILIAGGDILIRSHVENTLRAAGGNIVISGLIDRDVLIAAGTARITKTASISGDLLFLGGQLQVEGPVQGNIYVNGGDISLNSIIGGNVNGNVGKLTIGSSAVINGDLTYQSDSKAQIANTTQIRGKHNYKQIQQPQPEQNRLTKAFTAGSLFTLVTDIIISLLTITFLPLLTKNVLNRISESPISSAGVGFMFLFLMPIFSVFLLILLWLGLVSFLFYALILLLALFIGKIVLGWRIMLWWEKRNNREYLLDWKAAIVGPIVVFLLLLIPLLGWLVFFAIYLMAIGGVVQHLLEVIKTQRNIPPVKHKE